MNENKVKILFCGDVEGRFDQLVRRVNTIIQKSGQFDLLLCTGNFFGINNREFLPYRLGDKKVPVPTYILGPNNADTQQQYPTNQDEYELCENVYYLGKKGVFTDSRGLKLAYLSGVASNDGKLWTYNEQDVEDVVDAAMRGNPSFRGVDVLLTSQWPKGVIEQGKELKLPLGLESDFVSYLCMKLKPRYVVCGLEGVFYERPPFRCPNLGDHDTTLEFATRFIGLARVGNTNKDKWIYALNLLPLEKMKISELIQKTTDETPCPFHFSELENQLFHKKKRKSHQNQQFFYDMNASMDDNQHRRGKKQKTNIEFDQSKCWFCLSSPSVEKHLVITVGDFCYLALAKGGIVDEHLLICPMEHYQNSLVCSEDIKKEMEKFKESLREFYGRNNQVPVFFERNYKTSHMQLQCIPIPSKATRELKEIFLDESEAAGFRLETLENHNRLNQVIPTKTPYFIVELPNSDMLYTKIHGASFPLSFGRDVLASGPILNLPNRVEYRDCLMDKKQEELIVARIRTDYQPYDFTL